MYKHILIPTDGSELSDKAIEAGIRFANHVGARAAGVEYDSGYEQSDRPHEAIIRAAEKNGCDLIFMASHGRRGISALVHGSETQGVLTHSKIPTLVYR
jgi:nucleotide-binding universal stress UspA family protein